jgi:hypothetical protein
LLVWKLVCASGLVTAEAGSPLDGQELACTSGLVAGIWIWIPVASAWLEIGMYQLSYYC